MRIGWLAVVVSMLAAACGDGDVPDTSDELFEPDAILDVVVTMDAGDFDALRNQTRSIPDTLQGDCLAQPFDSPFTKFHADVRVDGVDYRDVSIKKKGFFGSGLGPGSIAKPSLKLDASAYVDGQRFGGAGGLDMLVLNNSVQDPSYVRTCLAYRVFGDAGVVAPRCGFAHLTVNGEDLGLYVHVEDVDDQFLDRRFDDPSGALYKGILSDFRTGWSTTFDLQEGDAATADLDALTAACEGPDDALLAGVEAEVDVERFLTLWATESLLRHWDGYTGNTNNFFLYDDPASGFVVVPWGTDQVMQNGADAPASVYGTAALANRLYQLPAIATRYVDRLREVMTASWDEAALLAEIDRMVALIGPLAGDLAAPVEDVRTFINGRRAVIDAELTAGPAPYTTPLRGSFCMAPIGHVTGTFGTRWGTGGADPWTSGTGTLTATVNGAPLAFTMYGATADFDANDPSKASLVLYAAQPSGHIAVVVLSVLATRVAPGASLGIDWNPSYGALYDYDPGTQAFVAQGTFGIGHVDIDAGATTGDVPVDGGFDADLVGPF
jgi:hypothetical protein